MKKQGCLYGALAALLLVAACSKEQPAGEQPVTQTEAKLTINALPSGDVLIDGEPAGKSPLTDVAMAPGAHKVVVRREGFKDFTSEVSLASGENKSLDCTLIAKDPADPAVLRALADNMEMVWSELEEEERFRGGKTKAVQIIFPRGKLRPQDLDNFRIDLTEKFEPGGRIEFRIGKTTIHKSEPFDPEEFQVVQEIPLDVRAGIKKGKKITWGYHPPKGRAITAQFEVVSEDKRLDYRMKKLEERVANQPDLVREQLRAQLLLNKRYFYAAFKTAANVVRQCSEVPPQAIAVMQGALRGMKLSKTAVWKETTEFARGVPSAGAPGPRSGGVAERPLADVAPSRAAGLAFFEAGHLLELPGGPLDHRIVHRDLLLGGARLALDVAAVRLHLPGAAVIVAPADRRTSRSSIVACVRLLDRGTKISTRESRGYASWQSAEPM